MLTVLPADRRVASAVRRFPPGCGRPRNAAAQKPPHPHPSSTTKPPHPHPSSTTKPPLPNPSARAATATAAPLPRGTVPAPASSGTVGVDHGTGNGSDAAAAVTVRRAWARRRYPPGCGRGVTVAKPPALVAEGEGEAGASKPPAELCIEAKAKACDREAVLCGCAIDDGEFSSDGGRNAVGSLWS